MFGALKKGLQSLGEKLGLSKPSEEKKQDELKPEVKVEIKVEEKPLIKEEPIFIEPKKEKPVSKPIVQEPKIEPKKIESPKIETPKVEFPDELEYLKKEIELAKEQEQELETVIKEEPKKEVKIELPKPSLNLESKDLKLKQDIKSHPEEDAILMQEKKLEKKVSIFTKLKSVFADKYFLSDSEIVELIDQFEMSMLQSDVSLQVCDLLTKSLKDKIKKDGVSKSHQEEYLKKLFLDIVFENYPKSLDENFFKQEKKPFVILFVGTNGGGKTTNIAKLTYYLKQHNKTVVLAASDTYRAAAIDQLEGHATKLNVPIIKGKYGQDPASVAYDAVAFARVKNLDFVLVDSSGRQDNSQNLMKELEKIKKVIQPDFTVFVAEAITGQTALAQAESFNKYINFNSFILTKADVDEKGGTLLSISLGMKKPVLFLGIGQEYKDIAFFNKEFLEQVI